MCVCVFSSECGHVLDDNLSRVAFFFNLLPLYIILYIFCFLVTLEESQILVLLKLFKKE